MTTGKERMEAAFKGERSDRLPVYLITGGQYAEKVYLGSVFHST